MNPELIFISFSKRFAQKVASVIYLTLQSIYPDPEKVQFFFSEVSINAGGFEKQIKENLKAAKIAVSVLTPENQKESPWLMYEAGALALSTENNGGELIPYLFCRHRNNVEVPLQRLNNYQYQRWAGDLNREQFCTLILQINQLLAPEHRTDPIVLRSSLYQLWSQSIDPQFKKIADDLYDPAISALDRAADSTANVALDGEIFAATFQQGIAALTDDFAPKTPAELGDQFANVLDFFIPSEWKFRGPLEIKYNATRVIVNNTRISTFVAFTDGSNILLFDRTKEEGLTNVTNNRLDMFGSVQFENRSIPIKINSPEFLSAPIDRIVPLYGAAFENNQLRAHDDVETVVMFGIAVHMQPEHLLLAKKSGSKALILTSLSKAKSLPQDRLTSKASLAIAQL